MASSHGFSSSFLLFEISCSLIVIFCIIVVVGLNCAEYLSFVVLFGVGAGAGFCICYRPALVCVFVWCMQ
jgi:hypothetical protein